MEGGAMEVETISSKDVIETATMMVTTRTRPKTNLTVEIRIDGEFTWDQDDLEDPGAYLIHLMEETRATRNVELVGPTGSPTFNSQVTMTGGYFVLQVQPGAMTGISQQGITVLPHLGQQVKIYAGGHNA